MGLFAVYTPYTIIYVGDFFLIQTRDCTLSSRKYKRGTEG